MVEDNVEPRETRSMPIGGDLTTMAENDQARSLLAIEVKRPRVRLPGHRRKSPADWIADALGTVNAGGAAVESCLRNGGGFYTALSTT